jgi:hypothetical protein
LYAVADPSAHSWDAVIDAIASAVHRRPFRLRVSAKLLRAAAGITETFGRMSGRAVVFNREKAEEMLAADWICDVAGSEVLLPPAEVTPLREGIERTSSWYIRQGWL